MENTYFIYFVSLLKITSTLKVTGGKRQLTSSCSLCLAQRHLAKGQVGLQSSQYSYSACEVTLGYISPEGRAPFCKLAQRRCSFLIWPWTPVENIHQYCPVTAHTDSITGCPGRGWVFFHQECHVTALHRMRENELDGLQSSFQFNFSAALTLSLYRSMNYRMNLWCPKFLSHL